ncbi:MAG: aminotransferase, partial [Paramuribaculum sp.]|nr:aminotransferase [Paramuribaculum sp.]
MSEISDRDGIVIQARSGSTRMPSKILRAFDGETRIIDIIIEKIKKSCPDKTIVVATTENPSDNIIADIVAAHKVECFRGSEEDVLDRFIGAADKFGLDRIIRVCSDNPFLQTDSFNELFKAQSCSGADYVAFAFPDGRPTIKSHLG